jgi:uncharacterized protein YndB with AHSA1/START domain
MTDRSVNHATFTLERTYPVTTANVFDAWSDPAKKAKWMAGSARHSLDFRVGGQEVVRAEPDGKVLTFTTTYLEIIPGERIAYTSTMYADDQLTTASLTTVEFASTGDATQLVLTEHGAYLDGHELPEWREHGTSEQLDALGRLCTPTAAS